MKTIKLNSRVKTIVVLTALLTKLAVCGMAQNSIEYKKLPVIVGLQIHNFSMPLRDIRSHFSHPGLFLGTEFVYRQKSKLFQNVNIGGYTNREIGNGLFINTQIGIRPKIISGFYGEVKAGIGYLWAFHPTKAYEYVDGDWQNITGGTSQLIFPLDLGFGYSFTTNRSELSPFFNYQINPALFYNKTLPVNIYTNCMFGIRIKLSK